MSLDLVSKRILYQTEVLKYFSITIITLLHRKFYHNADKFSFKNIADVWICIRWIRNFEIHKIKIVFSII